MVMVDAIEAAGLLNELKCQEDLGVFNETPDIWVVTSRGIPVGVIEVKRPDDKIMEEPLAHGQIYDYMLRLRSFHGLKHVFGIVTTYKQWRVYWLPSTDPIAASDTINSAAEQEEDYRYDINNSPLITSASELFMAQMFI
jgi:hypothetical protein